MLKYPFDRFKLCVGGSGDAGFSSGSATGDAGYDSGAGSVSSNPGVSTSLESQAAAQAAANAAAGYGAFWSDPANTEAGRELAARGNTAANPTTSDSGANPFNPLTQAGSYQNYQLSHPAATAMSERTALSAIEPQRAGYTSILDLGDSKTQALIHGGMTPMDALNQQLQGAYQTQTLTDDRFFANELSKANHNNVEVSANYHAWANATGIPQAPNPFEHVGDLALGFEKGLYGKSGAQVTTPTNLSVLSLPYGGLQDVAWMNAMDYDRTGGQNQIRPDWSQPISTIERAKSSGEMGLYGNLNSYSSGYGNLDLPTQQRIGYQAAKSAGWSVNIDTRNPAADYNALGYGMPYTPPSQQDRDTEFKSTLSVMDGFALQAPFRSDGKTQTGDFGLKTPFISLSSTTMDTETPQSGTIPYIGTVPWLSGVLSNFQPIEKTSVRSLTDGTTITSTSYGKTPFTSMFQSVTPTDEKALPYTRIAALTNPLMAGDTMKQMFTEALTDKFNPSNSKNIREQNQMTDVGFSSKYTALRDDPAMFLTSLALGGALGASGGMLRSVGVGTKYLAPASKAGEYYQGASKLVSGTAAGVYMNDLTERVTGTSLGGYERALLPAWSGDKEGFANISKNWGGLPYAKQQLDKSVMTEMVPFVIGVGAGAKAGDWLSQRVQTRGLPEVTNPEEISYFSGEGFPTNQNIKTSDLIHSFNTGEMQINKGLGGSGRSLMLDSKMMPSGEPLKRVPNNPQRGAIAGETFIYSGAETPHLDTGFVGAGKSELPVMFNAPTGQAYFTKAGMNQGAGGFGMSSDLFGIYRNPTMYRSSVKSGEYSEIPKSILNTPTRGMSTNNPLNPRNQAIAEWMGTNAEFGKPVIGQYGKSEWQYLIKEGSAVNTKKAGWFTDKGSGSRIILQDVTYTGQGTAPKPKANNPMTGKPMQGMGRFYVEIGVGSSRSGSSKTLAPFYVTSFGKSGTSSTKSTSRSSPFSSYAGTSKASASSSFSPRAYTLPDFTTTLKSSSTKSPSSFITPSYTPSSKPPSYDIPTYSQPPTRSPPSYKQPTYKPPVYTPPPTYKKPPTGGGFPFGSGGSGSTPGSPRGKNTWREIIPIESEILSWGRKAGRSAKQPAFMNEIMGTTKRAPKRRGRKK